MGGTQCEEGIVCRRNANRAAGIRTPTHRCKAGGNGNGNGNGLARSTTNGISNILKPAVSACIRERLQERGVSFLANDNIAAHLEPGELAELQIEVADKVRDLLQRASIQAGEVALIRGMVRQLRWALTTRRP